ncbi:MAG: T9SS type A sorting domain-containing protein [Candidatus Marinimicrobia bacterium]|nr:T9SS type A sorting domain-containing protein [Candidatus Neomarinimicrobiota bacterium]
MKKYLLILTSMFALTAMVFAASFNIDLERTDSSVLIQKNSYDKLVTTFTYTGITTFQVESDRGLFNEIFIPNTFSIGEIGTPKLPASKELIEIPFGAEVSAKVVNYTVSEYRLSDFDISNPLMPTQPSLSKSVDPATVVFEYNQEVYSNDKYSSHDLASVEILGVMRGMRLARLVVAPVQYNPVTGMIRVYNDIEVEVQFDGSDIARTENIKASTYSPYFEAIYASILNNNGRDYPDHPDLTKYPVKYLIVSDPMFENILQPFIDWKTKKGFEVITGYTNEIGSSVGSIQNWINGYYNAGTPDDPAPSFILFVGDVQQIPASATGSSSGKKTDLYYGSVDGDIFPEMYYGRFSATTTSQLQVQIDKTLYYEKYEFSDPSFLDRVTLIAGADGSWNPAVGQPTVQYGTENYWNTANGFSQVNDYLTSYGGCYDTVDDGVGFINYTAHCSETSWGDPSLSQSDVNSFSNNGQYPLAVGNCCLAADFGYGECIGETWMRKANAGAVAYIGSSPSSYWFEDFYWAVGAFPISGDNNGYVPSYEETSWGVYDGPFVTDYVTADGLVFIGNLAVTEVDIQGYPQHSSPEYYWEAYNLLGDPSLVIYQTQGELNDVDYMDILPIGIDYFEVQADPGSYVAISFEGELRGTALVDGSGVVSIPIIPITNSGMADILVTKPQYQPYIEQVLVAPLDGPFVTIDEFVINAGGDDIIEFGETVTLDVSFKNVGSDPATNLSVSIMTTDSFIVLSDASEMIGNIGVDEVVTVQDAFTFGVMNNVPDDHNFSFDVTITATEDVWENNMNMTAFAPVITLGSVGVTNDDDGNGRLDPGETADLVVPLINDGGAVANNIAAILSTTDEFLTINSSSDELASLGGGSTGNVTFNVTVSADAEIGHNVNFGVGITADNDYSTSGSFSLSVGLCLEDFETGYFSMYPWETDWEISGDAYEGSYSAKSTNNSDNTTSELAVTLSVTTSDQISFFRKVSSEDNYDYLKFYIDGSLQDEWAGEVAWGEVSYPVTYGEHTFTWEYYKDGSVSNGSDCAWVDYIIFPPVGVPTPANFVVNPQSFNVNLNVNETTTENLALSNTGGSSVVYSINLIESADRTASAENDYQTDVEADIYKKQQIADGLVIPKSTTQDVINQNNEPNSRAVDVTIVCDGGTWQYETGWTIIDAFGNFIASGGAPYNGNASLDNGIYTVNATDSYGDGWNGDYLTITANDGTVFLNWTLDSGTEGSTTFEVDVAPPISWMDISQSSGSLNGGETDNIEVSFNTSELEFGATYTAEMIIENSVGVDVIVPISLTVGEPGPQPQLAVNVSSLDNEMPINQSSTVNFEITNIGEDESTLSYELEVGENADWLSVYPPIGECDFEETDNIVATFSSDGLNPGTYTTDLLINSNGGYETLPVTLVVSDCVNCPDWEVHVPGFEYNLTLTGLLFIEGEESFDENDMVGAFVGDEVRGVASPSYFPLTGSYTVNLMIYSNESSGETITFKAYDYSQDVIFENVIETINFVANDIIGNDLTPFEFNASGAETINLDFIAGWNWFSINIENTEMDLNTVLSSLGNSATFIKNQSGYANYYDDFGWYSGNGLDDFAVTSMYMLQMNVDGLLSFIGAPVNFQNTPIDLLGGWNWIGYLPQTPNNLNDALASIEPNGAFIKNQTSYANYYDEFGWYSGNGLNDMIPGDGFMLQMNADAQLIYGIPSNVAKIYDNEETKELHWSVNPHQFEYNMAITAELEAGSQLAVFVDDEVRGVVESTYFPLTDSYTANLMVYGNDGEELSFRVYQEANDTELDILDHLTFEVNGIIGNDIEPVLLRTLSLPEDYSLSQNYPNPFNPSTTISYQLQATSSVLLAIYNVNGQLVETLVTGQLDAGYHSVVWNADDFASGVYIVKLTADGFTQTQKMLLMK